MAKLTNNLSKFIMLTRKNKAFTLIELLVVISIIATLMSILTPALSLAKSQARFVLCQSNIRQLVLANILYANDNDSHYVPAASDIHLSNGGYNRWHGVREKANEPFDPSKGPLAKYLGDGDVKECPMRIKFVQEPDWDASFEKGGGGYGYNATYIGNSSSSRDTAKITDISRPAQTLMFADCAMANQNDGVAYIHEYSFIQPPYFLNNRGQLLLDSMSISPSIHFRHRGKADLAWSDGHVSSEARADYNKENVYGVKSADFDIGWLAPLDNSPYDLR